MRVAAALAAAVCAGCLQTPAQPPPTPLGALLERAREARADWPEQRALVLSGDARSSGVSGAFRLELYGGGRYRLEVDGPVRRVSASDGRVAWQREGRGPARRLTLRERDAQELWVRALDGSWCDADAPLARRVARGRGGQALVVVDLPGEAPPLALEVAPEDGLPRALVETRRGRTTRWRFEGWGPRAGRPLPASIAFEGSSALGTRLDVTQVAWLPAEPARLARPSDVGDASFDRLASDEVQGRRLASGHLLVPVTLAGAQEPLWFLVDTGASGLVVDADVARRLRLPVVGTVGAIGGARNAAARLVQADSLRVGPLVLDAPRLLALDLLGFESRLDVDLHGIVGGDLFLRAAVRLPAADRPAVLTLRPPGGFDDEVAAAGVRWTTVLPSDAVACVRVDVEARGAGWFLLDTGAAWGAALHAPWLAPLGLPDGRAWRPGGARGVFGETRTQVGTLAYLDLGERRLAAVEVHLALAREGSLADEVLAGNLGLQALAPFSVVVDLGRERLALLSP